MKGYTGPVGRSTARANRASAPRGPRQQMGQPFGLHHRRLVRARRAEPLKCEPGVAEHLLDAVTAEQCAHVGDRASTVLPSCAPVAVVRSAAAAQCSVTPGWPFSANISAPCTAIPG